MSNPPEWLLMSLPVIGTLAAILVPVILAHRTRLDKLDDRLRAVETNIARITGRLEERRDREISEGTLARHDEVLIQGMQRRRGPAT